MIYRGIKMTPNRGLETTITHFALKSAVEQGVEGSAVLREALAGADQGRPRIHLQADSHMAGKLALPLGRSLQELSLWASSQHGGWVPRGSNLRHRRQWREWGRVEFASFLRPGHCTGPLLCAIGHMP